jgi:type IV pilus assembly protein PilV
MISKRYSSFRSISQGFALIESLVSLVILVVGLLGILGLQSNTMKFSHRSELRSQATVLAYNLLERIRSNYYSDDAELAQRESLLKQSVALDFAQTLSTPVDCATNSCTNAQLYAYDLYHWREELVDSLPGADAQISFRAATGAIVVTVRYAELLDAEDDDGTVNEESDFVLETRI